MSWCQTATCIEEADGIDHCEKSWNFFPEFQIYISLKKHENNHKQKKYTTKIAPIFSGNFLWVISR